MIEVENLYKSYGTKEIFKNQSITLDLDAQKAVPCKEGDFELPSTLEGMKEYLKLMHGLKNVQKTFSLNGFRFVRKGLRWKNCSGRENWNWKKREKTGIRS